MGITQEQLQIELLLKNNGIKATLDSVINAMKKLGIASDKVDDTLEGLGDEFSNVGKKANNSLNNINVNKLTAELNSVKTALKGISSSTTSEMNKVKASISSLDTVIKNQEKNISSLKTQIQSIGQSGGDTSTLEKQLVAEQNALTTNQAKMKNYQGTLTELMNREQMIAKSSNALKASIGVLNVGMNTGSKSSKDLGSNVEDLGNKMDGLNESGANSMEGFKQALQSAIESVGGAKKTIQDLYKDITGKSKMHLGRMNTRTYVPEVGDAKYDDEGFEIGKYTAEEIANLQKEAEAITKRNQQANKMVEINNRLKTSEKEVQKAMEQMASTSEKTKQSQEDLNRSQNNSSSSTSKLKTSLQQLTQKWRENNQGTKEAVKANKEATQSFNTLGTSIGNMMAKLGLVFGVYQLINFGKECLNLGSDLQEVDNVVNQVFPNATAQIQKWAEESMKAYGLSELAYKQTIGTLGAMARNFTSSEEEALSMSKTLTELTGDISSFYNVSQDEAFTAVKSIFTGETEVMKRYGVIMTQDAIQAWMLKQGLQGVYSEMNTGQQVMIRYMYAQDQLRFAMGDFART